MKPKKKKNLKMMWSDINIRARGNPIVSSCSGYIKAGSLTALMGTSGSGKSVLMKFLAGRQEDMPEVSGSGLAVLDGHRLDLNIKHHRVVYVPQENNSLTPCLTVKEHIVLACRMQVDPDLDYAERVQSIIDNMGLEELQDLVVGHADKEGVSTDERRLIVTGMELVAHPDVALLDGPVDGLDGTAALETIAYMKEMCQQNNSGYMVAIHQPSNQILSLFDRFCVLGRDGEMVFFGNLAQMVKHFSTTLECEVPWGLPPTEVFLSKFRQGKAAEPGALAIAFRESSYCRKLNTEIAAQDTEPFLGVKPDSSSFCADYVVLLNRQLKIAIRDPSVYFVQYVLQYIIAVLAGAVFWEKGELSAADDRVNSLFMSSMILGFLVTFIFVFKSSYYAQHVLVTNHERGNNAYWGITGFLADLSITLVANFGFVVGIIITYRLVGFDNKGLGNVVALSVMQSFVGDAIPHVIAQLTAPSRTQAVIVTFFVMFVTFFFSGIGFVRESTMAEGIAWITDLSPFKYFGLGAIAAVFDGRVFDCATGNTYPTGGFTGLGALVSAECITSVYKFDCDDTETLNSVVFAGGQLVSYDITCRVSGKEIVTSIFDLDSMPSINDALRDIFIYAIMLNLLILLFQCYPPNALRSKFWYMLGKPFYVETGLGNSDDPSARALDKVVEIKQADSKGGGGRADGGGEAEENSLLGDEKKGDDSKWAEKKAGSSAQLVVRDLAAVLRTDTSMHVVHPMSFLAQSGKVCGIMGPGGSGKTSLLNALGGNASHTIVSGRVTLDGRLLTRSMVGYVQQHETLSPSFTVAELVYDACEMSTAKKREECLEIVERILDQAGLAAVRDVQYKRLTAAQRKLAEMASVVVTQPRVLLVDELTSGLDSAAAIQVTGVLRNLAKFNNTVVIASFDQPSRTVFGMIDELLLLDASGRLAFFGSQTNAQNFFGSCGISVPHFLNPIDAYVDVLREAPHLTADDKKGQDDEKAAKAQDDDDDMVGGPAEGDLGASATGLGASTADLSNEARAIKSAIFGDTVTNIENEPSGVRPDLGWSKLFRASRYAHKVPVVDDLKENQAPPQRSELYRFWRLFLRNLLYFFWREPTAYAERGMTLLPLSILAGIVYFDTPLIESRLLDLRGLVVLQTIGVMIFCIGNTEVVSRMRRECLAGYTNNLYKFPTWTLAYFLSQLIISFVVALIFSMPLHFMLNQPAGDLMYITTVIWMLIVFTDGLVLTIVEISDGEVLRSITSSFLIIIVLLLFSEGIESTREMPPSVSWLPQLLPVKYAVRGILRTYYNGEIINVHGSQVPGNQVLDSFGLNYPPSQNEQTDLLIVTCFMLGMRILHMLLLWARNRAMGDPTHSQIDLHVISSRIKVFFKNCFSAKSRVAVA